MFTLNDYADVLLEFLRREKDGKKVKKAIKAWVEMLKRHHRIAESGKILNILEDRFERMNEKALVTISDETEKQYLKKFFQTKKIKADWEINPNLLGGARIVWNNILIDNTVNGQLNRLEDKLAGKK